MLLGMKTAVPLVVSVVTLCGVIVNVIMTRRLAAKREEFEAKQKDKELAAARLQGWVKRYAELYKATLDLKAAFTTEQAQADQEQELARIRKIIDLVDDFEGGIPSEPFELTEEMTKALHTVRTASAAVLIDGTSLMRASANEVKRTADTIEEGWRGRERVDTKQDPDDFHHIPAQKALISLDCWLSTFDVDAHTHVDLPTGDGAHAELGSERLPPRTLRGWIASRVVQWRSNR